MPVVIPSAPVSGVQDLLGSGSFNGLPWGPTTQFHVSSLTGLHDLPAIRTFDASRPGDQGIFRGTDLLGPRIVTFDLTIIGTSNADYYVQANQVAAAFSLQTAELPMYFHNSTRMLNVRCRRRSIPYDCGHTDYAGVATLEVMASDPRVYDATASNVNTGMAQSSGGLVFPFIFPFTFGASGAGGQMQVTNSGTFAVRPVLTITGPVDTPILENTTAGKKLRFNLVLASTDTLIIDLDARTVLLNGTASRRSTMSADSQWWEITPGVTTIRFSNAGVYQAAASLTFPFRSAWI